MIKTNNIRISLVTLLMLLMNFVVTSQSTVSIGGGTSNIYRYPFYGLYDYSHTMFIYTQSELGSSSTINNLEFQLGGYSTPYTYNNLTIKLAHTTDNEFGTNIKVDLTNLNNSDLTTVLSGYNLTISSNGWVSFTFTTPFSYDGTSNLLVIIENRDGSWASGYGYSENVFDNCSCSNDYMSWYKYQDGSYPSGYGTRDQSYRPNIKINTAAPLPIELISFTGFEDNGNVNLEWSVASQINNDYFTLEHSIDGYLWETISNISGAGNTSESITYDYVHTKPKNGVNYYRLSQTDFDGKFEVFNPIAVYVRVEKKYIISRCNLLGQPVSEDYSGLMVLIWDNGEKELILNTKY